MNRLLASSAAGLLLLVGLTGCSLDTATASGDGGGVTDTSGQASTDNSGTTDTSTDDSVSPEFQAALDKAQTYSDTMHMSKAGLYEQLTSSAGEGFEKDAAQYAVDHVDADWDANALAKAKDYREQMSMSKAGILEQLTSDAGEGFTQSQAEYAIEHLDD